MIEFADTSIIAQLGIPDMRVPIAYALTYPDRFKSNLPSITEQDRKDLEFAADIGVDFIFDEQWRPYVLEFNLSPSLAQPDAVRYF